MNTDQHHETAVLDLISHQIVSYLEVHANTILRSHPNVSCQRIQSLPPRPRHWPAKFSVRHSPVSFRVLRAKLNCSCFNTLRLYGVLHSLLLDLPLALYIATTNLDKNLASARQRDQDGVRNPGTARQWATRSLPHETLADRLESYLGRYQTNNPRRCTSAGILCYLSLTVLSGRCWSSMKLRRRL